MAQLRRALAIAPVETLQPPYSLIERSSEDEIMPFADAQGIGIVIYSPMQSGLLSGAMTAERIHRADRRRPRDDRGRLDG